jgi:hypothetical protein
MLDIQEIFWQFSYLIQGITSVPYPQKSALIYAQFSAKLCFNLHETLKLSKLV